MILSSTEDLYRPCVRFVRPVRAQSEAQAAGSDKEAQSVGVERTRSEVMEGSRRPEEGETMRKRLTVAPSTEVRVADSR